MASRPAPASLPVIVAKFGGTSVASLEKIENAARKILILREAGHPVIAVVSAMGKETDRLEEMAVELGALTNADMAREVDVLMSTGEQVSIALLAMTLIKLGQPARSYTGGQVAIRTDSRHTKARIRDIDRQSVDADLAAGRVVIVAGFQGVSDEGSITTLGRGGSDTTAVALAAVFEAGECRIYTDVKGVYTTDPRVVSDAQLMERVTFEEMLELASLGSRVLHTRSVEFASKYRVPLRVLSSFEEGTGTLITSDEVEEAMEQPIISGIAFARDEAKLTVRGVKDVPGVASHILSPVSAASIEVDMIVQNVSDDQTTDFTFTVSRKDYDQALAIVESLRETLGAREVSGDDRIAKLSLVGVGMRSHAGVASRMFEVLAEEGINIQMISTSEIKISVVIAEKYLELATRALHSAFDLAKAGSD